MSEVNPYAPPRDDVALPVDRGPLPEGIRRYALDPGALRALLDRQWRAFVVRMVLALGMYLGVLAAVQRVTLDALVYLVPMLAAYLLGGALFRRWRLRRAERAVLQGFELLLAPRVLRRSAHRFAPAEMLATEVTSIVEIAAGLSIEARGAGRRVFVSRAVAGYSDLRAHVARWRAIEPRAGLAAVARRWSHVRGERVWGDVTDRALADELAAVRALAMPARGPVIRPMRRLAIVALVWAVVVAMMWWLFFAT